MGRYFIRRRPIIANIRADVWPFFAADTLVELTAKERREIAATHGPCQTYYKPQDASQAHRWVKDGGHHETGLYTDHDGRIRYARDGY